MKTTTRAKAYTGRSYMHRIPEAYELFHTCGHYGSSTTWARDPRTAVDVRRQQAMDCNGCRWGRPELVRTTRNDRLKLIE